MIGKKKNKKEKNIIAKEIKPEGNGHLIKVIDADGYSLPPAEFDTVLDLVRNHSARIQDDNTIQLSKEVFDGEGFSVQRGWRDDHVATEQPWTYSPSSLDRDFLLSYDTLREIYRRSPHVRPAVDSIIKEISQLPVKVDGPGKDEVEEFIERPNISKESWSAIIQQLLNDLLVLDQAVIEKVRSLSGKIVEIYVRDASQFRPVPDSSRSYTTYFKQIITNNAGRKIDTINHDVDDIVWLIQFPRSYSFYGTPIIETVVNEVSTLLYSSKSIARHFVDDEIPPGILYLERIGRKAYERAKAQFEAHRGEEGKKRINVVDNVSKAEWIPFTRPFREMQLAEITLLIQEIVFRNFGISSIDIGDAQGLTRQTADRLWKTGRSKLFRPLVTLLTNKLNKELISEIAPDTEIKFVLEPAVDVESAKELSDAGIITKNEARKTLGFDPLDGGDKLAVRVGNQYLVLEDNMSTGTSKNQESEPKETTQDIIDSFQEQYKGLDEQYKQWSREYENDIIERQTFGSIKFEKEFNAIFEEYLREINSEWGRAQSELLRRFETEIKNPLKIKLVNGQPKIVGGSQQLLDEKILVGIEERMMPISNKYMRKSSNLGRRYATSSFGKSMVTGAEASKIAQQHLDELARYWRETYSEDLFLQVDKIRRTTNVRNVASRKKEVKSLLAVFSNRRLRIIAHGLTRGVASISLLAADRGKTNVKWMCNLDATTCDDCEDLSYGGIGGQGIYTIHSLPKMPGDPSLICCENCRCWLDFVKDDKYMPSPSSGPDLTAFLIPELFAGIAAKAPAIGSRAATKAEVDVVRQIIQNNVDPRIFELLDRKKIIGVNKFKSFKGSPSTTFIYDPKVASIGIQDDIMKSIMKGEVSPQTTDAILGGIPHEFSHHVLVQPGMRTKVSRLGRKILRSFKKEELPIFEHSILSSIEDVRGLSGVEYTTALNFRVGSEIAAMVLERRFGSRTQLINHLSRNVNFVSSKTGNDLVFTTVKPTNSQLDKLVDIVEMELFGTTNVLAKSVTKLPKSAIRPTFRSPSGPLVESRRKFLDNPVESSKGNLIRFQDDIEGPITGRPHGTYFSFEHKDFPSPHKFPGTKLTKAKVNTENILFLKERGNVNYHIKGDIGGNVPASSGVEAVRTIKGSKHLDDLLLLEVSEIRNELRRKGIVRGIDFRTLGSELADKKYLMEIYGADLARKEGFDAMILGDSIAPEFTEFVALTDDAFKLEGLSTLFPKSTFNKAQKDLISKIIKDTNKLIDEDKAFKKAVNFDFTPDEFFVSVDEINFMNKFVEIRKNELKKIVTKSGTSQDFKALSDMLSDWVSDANFPAGAVLKDFVTRHGMASPTTFHSKFIGSNKLLLKELVEDSAKELIAKLKTTLGITDIDSILLIAHAHNKTILKRKFPKGKIKLYRGVSEKYFKNLGISAEDALKIDNISDNSLSSWTNHKGIASSYDRYILETEVSIDDVFLSHESGLFGGSPSEYILLGKPRKIKISDVRARKE